MRLADAFAADRDWISDGDFVVTCTCGLQQRVGEMLLDEGADLTVYDCARCENSVVGVMTNNAATDLWLSVSAMTRSHGSQGHRINGYLVGSKVDLALQPPGTGLDDAELLLATPNFFLALRDL